MSNNRSSGGVRGRDHHVRQRRDAALERTRSITKTVAVASLAAVAAFGIYVSRALPGHAATSTGTTAGSTGSSAGVTQSGGGTASGSSTQLAPPSSPPAQSQSQAPVVSGSS